MDSRDAGGGGGGAGRIRINTLDETPIPSTFSPDESTGLTTIDTLQSR